MMLFSKIEDRIVTYAESKKAIVMVYLLYVYINGLHHFTIVSFNLIIIVYITIKKKKNSKVESFIKYFTINKINLT